jgi:NAD(P)-dependent dehydrogenase (short-subunit alcohol dehydrogenase family)
LKTILITGASSGVGLATTKILAAKGHKIIMICRNVEKGLDIVENLQKEHPDYDLDVIGMDLEDLQSIVSGTKYIIAKYEALDVIINNAGGIFSEREITMNGFEKAFQVNHLGHFLLTVRLLPLLLESAESRVINLSSEYHRRGKIDIDNLNGEKKFGGWMQYGNTKLMNIVFAKALANKYQSKGLNAFSVHPGVVRTGFGSNNTGLLGLFNKMPFLITPEKGAETSVFLATEDIKNLKNGGYYKSAKLASADLQAHDTDNQEKLWAKSEAMLKAKAFL